MTAPSHVANGHLKRTYTPVWILAAFVSLAVACSDAPVEPDVDASPLPPPDASLADAYTPDGCVPDAVPADESPPDASLVVLTIEVE